MKRYAGIALLIGLGVVAGCRRHPAAETGPKPTAYGAAVVESSGGKQVGEPGGALPQPLVVQVNDAQGNALPGAVVRFAGGSDVAFSPAAVLTDSSGQATTTATLGDTPGRYTLTASTPDAAGKAISLQLTELVAGYQEQLGERLNAVYCSRCHNAESTPQQVSNYDNLDVKPHTFTDGDTMNKLSDSDLTALISHGGPALNRSALMPAYGTTLNKAEVQALIAYIRLVSDPPFERTGVHYGKQ
ncbi:MAG: c-type cytochrome [Acidobacteriota bacterium]|nr:c-type cytochrome [Acidobacteriota bacterium]